MFVDFGRTVTSRLFSIIRRFLGFPDLTEWVLKTGAIDINADGGELGNALQAASYNGHKAVVRLLLENGANVKSEGGYYGAARQAASRHGHEAVVKLLLENGANVNSKVDDYRAEELVRSLRR
jgi:Ankyrin repeats (3 copies)